MPSDSSSNGSDLGLPNSFLWMKYASLRSFKSSLILFLILSGRSLGKLSKSNSESRKSMSSTSISA